MLVLSRQRDESIVIGDNIVVTIVDIRGDKVRLGIQAPTEIPVYRREALTPSSGNRAAAANPRFLACSVCSGGSGPPRPIPFPAALSLGFLAGMSRNPQGGSTTKPLKASKLPKVSSLSGR